ncbi:MAG: response regulator [Lysobacterales bacterium]
MTSDLTRILMVDDDPQILKLAVLGINLACPDLKISTVGSGTLALETVSKDQPDLVVLDMNMPEMDGRETYTKLRQLTSPACDVPVVFLTGRSEFCESLPGCLGVIDKPFSPREIGDQLLALWQGQYPDPAVSVSDGVASSESDFKETPKSGQEGT